MKKLLDFYKKIDPSAKSTIEILLCYPGIKAVFFHHLAHWLYCWKIPFLPRLISEISRWLTGIEIHPGAKLSDCVAIDHGMGVVIGETAEIGSHVLIYHGVTLGATQHEPGKRHPSVQDGVIIGAGSKLLGDIVIGENAKIGANSVVLSDIAANTSCAGIPAKPVQKRDPLQKQWDIDFQI